MENVKVKFSLNWAFLFGLLGALTLWLLGLALVIEVHFHANEIYQWCQQLRAILAGGQ